jgi:hypothetical protein
MSLLCDLYVSTPDRALSYDEQQDVPDSERAQLTSLTFLEFSTLWAIIQGQPWDDPHMNGFEKLFDTEDGERAIYRFPAELVTLAASLDETSAAKAAEAWAQTDELHCSAADIRHVIDDLSRVSRVAQQSGRSLYLWNCL